MTVLAVDTSNQALGVALLDEDKIIGEYITNMKKNHSIRIMPAIQMLMKDCERTPRDLSKIVVAKGPGSYTGLRIGVTIAKTMAGRYICLLWEFPAWKFSLQEQVVILMELLRRYSMHAGDKFIPAYIVFKMGNLNQFKKINWS